MRDNNLFFPFKAPREDLSALTGVHFTSREIDVISCLISARGTSKICSFLSISPNTVFTYTRNIKLKLDCSSREGIIDFIEHSPISSLLKQHYANLVIHAAFEKCLLDISKVKTDTKHLRLIFYGENQAFEGTLSSHLKNHLGQAEIDVTINNEPNKENKNDTPSKDLILFLAAADRENIPKEVADCDAVNVFEQNNYYFLIFEILKKFLQGANPTKRIQNFLKQYERMKSKQLNQNAMCETSVKGEVYKKMQLLKNKKWFFVFAMFYLVPTCYFFYITKGNKKMPILQGQEDLTSASIRSDLPLPMPSVLLERPEELAQIDAKLKRGKGIQTIALVGPGGIGKTTLARQYARLQKSSIVWEINAETENTLVASFETLALSLAQTEEEKKEVKRIQEIKNPTEKADKVIQWVQTSLSFSKSWFLIFDNVINFKNIQKYFPSNQNAWGMGQVLITTRNTQMQNTNIHSILSLKELSDAQKFDLFAKILMGGADVPSLIPSQIEEIEKFLKEIPPYPLDVAIAAYYIKRTNVPYGKYLDYLQEYDDGFETLQKELLEGLGHYHKTRYSIIALSLKALAKVHKDFNALLLFISLLNPQAIPRDLLSTLKKDLIVDNFIHHLKAYSLINEASPLQEKPSLSLHRSIQKNSIIYLKKTLGLDKNTRLLKSLTQALESYILESIRAQDFDKIKNLVGHCQTFLSHTGHTDLLNDESRNMISGELGNIHLQLSNYTAAQEILEETLKRLHKKTSQNRERIARFSIYLADAYRESGDYNRAKPLLEESLHIYRKYFPEKHDKLAMSLAHLGAIYRHMGDHKKSKDLLEESITLYQKHSLDNLPDFAWAMVHLGNTYREMGNFSKATHLLEESILIYEKEFSNNHPTTAWNMAQLGNMYREWGKFEKATTLLEQSLAIYEKYFPYSHDRIAWNLTHLGDIYTYLGDHTKAITTLEKALSIHEKYFSKNHAGVARTLMCLGNAYRASGNHEKAKATLEKSLEVHLRHFSERHLRLAPVYMNLGITHQELGQYGEAKVLLYKSLDIYKQNEGDHSIERARVLRSLGFTEFLESHFDSAEKLFYQALEIAQQSDHPDLFKTWEALANLYLKQSTLMQTKASQQEAYKKQASDCLTQALQIIETYLSNNKRHRARIQNKMPQ